MLWDASWDQQNVINGKMYSNHIADILNRGAFPTPGVSSTTTPSGKPPGTSPSSEALTTATPTTGGGEEGTPQGTSPTSGVSTTATPATGGGGEGGDSNVDFFLKPSFFSANRSGVHHMVAR